MMYRKCPKCGAEQKDPALPDSCENCGLIFDKWLRSKYKSTLPQHHEPATAPWLKRFIQLKQQLLYTPDDVPRSRFYLYSVIFCVFLLWGGLFIFSDHYSAELNNSFMHTINLVFHEAGHIIFSLLGHFMAILGGSLLQLIVPLVFLVAFVMKKDTFAASIMLWWFAQSMMDLVAYIDDAQRQEMWLLGGVQGKDMPGIHDWNNILSQLGLLDAAHGLAVMTSWTAIILMLISFYWSFILLMKLKQQIR